MMSPERAKEHLGEMFALFTDFTTPPERIAAWLTPDYRQHVDGETLTLRDFIDHVTALRATLETLSITILKIVSDGRSAATVHISEGLKRTGERVRVRVVAFYTFDGERIACIDEATTLLVGADSDRRLGSAIGPA